MKSNENEIVNVPLTYREIDMLRIALIIMQSEGFYDYSLEEIAALRFYITPGAYGILTF